MTKHDEFMAALIADVHEEDGWLSDAQNAQLDTTWSGDAVSFCGEGSIDLSHVASIAARVWGESE